MSFFKSIFNKNNSVSQEKSKEVLGCHNCYSFEFEYDNYYSEYVCTKCGWTTEQTPNGNIRTIKKSIKNCTDSSQIKYKKLTKSVSSSDLEMNEKSAQFGGALIFDCDWAGLGNLQKALNEMESLLPGGFRNKPTIKTFPLEQSVVISVNIDTDYSEQIMSLNQQFLEILKKWGL